MNSIELTKKLVEIESTDPGAYEFEIEKFLKSYLDELKSYGVEVFESEVLDGRKNLMGVLRAAHAVRGDGVGAKHREPDFVVADIIRTAAGAKHREPDFVGADIIRPINELDSANSTELVLICHMDTVVVGNDWTKEPFKPKEIDGKLYGRGSTDMKSGLAVALKTFEYVVKEIGKEKLKRDFKIIFTVDEEADMKGVEKAIKDGWLNEKSFVADLEPTDKMIQVSHKGRFWVKIYVKGKTAHASRPELGIDANATLAEIISYIRNEITILPTDNELGKTTVTFGMMSGGYEPYVVPDSAYVTCDFRLAPPTYNHDIIRIINSAIANAKKIIANDVKVTYEITGDREYVKKNDDSKLLKAMKDVLKELHTETKNDDYLPVVTAFPGYTDTAVIASKLKNKETLSYGPGSLSLAHKPDEYVLLSDIERCERVYKKLVQYLLI